MFFFQIHFYFLCVIFRRFFANFSVSFPIFLETGFSALNATEYYANNSVLSIESIELMTIIDAKTGQNGRR